jgi:hypothetical protein
MYIGTANPLLLYRPMYTDVALKVLSEASSLRNTCELSHIVKDLFMINRVLIVYLLSFLAVLKINEPL